MKAIPISKQEYLARRAELKDHYWEVSHMIRSAKRARKTFAGMGQRAAQHTASYLSKVATQLNAKREHLKACARASVELSRKNCDAAPPY